MRRLIFIAVLSTLLTGWTDRLLLITLLVALLLGCTDNGAYRSPQKGGPGGGYYGVTTTTEAP